MLNESFYARGAEEVAQDLLGCILSVTLSGKEVRARIVETEAYVGEHDLACHASKGRSRRTEVMYGVPGRSYVYLIYGMYDLFNIVTSRVGDPQAVLIRAVEPLDELTGKTDGPGKLTRTLGITRAHHNLGLFGPEFWLEPASSPKYIAAGPRIGIDYAGVWKDAPLRFYDADSPFVSKPK